MALMSLPESKFETVINKIKAGGNEIWSVKAKILDIKKNKQYYELYFEDRLRLCSYVPESMFLDGLQKRLYVTFTDNSEAQKLCHMPHDSKNCNISNIEMTTPADFDIYDDRLFLYGNFDASNDDLKDMVNEKTGIDVTEKIQGDEQHAAVVVLDKKFHFDVTSLTWDLRDLNGMKLITAPVYKEKCVLVSGLSEDISETVLTCYIKNKKHSHGGPIQSVEFLCDGQALVVFVNEADLVNFSKKDNHLVEGCHLHVSISHSCLRKNYLKKWINIEDMQLLNLKPDSQPIKRSDQQTESLNKAPKVQPRKKLDQQTKSLNKTPEVQPRIKLDQQTKSLNKTPEVQPRKKLDQQTKSLNKAPEVQPRKAFDQIIESFNKVPDSQPTKKFDQQTESLNKAPEVQPRKAFDQIVESFNKVPDSQPTKKFDQQTESLNKAPEVQPRKTFDQIVESFNKVPDSQPTKKFDQQTESLNKAPEVQPRKTFDQIVESFNKVPDSQPTKILDQQTKSLNKAPEVQPRKKLDQQTESLNKAPEVQPRKAFDQIIESFNKVPDSQPTKILNKQPRSVNIDAFVQPSKTFSHIIDASNKVSDSQSKKSLIDAVCSKTTTKDSFPDRANANGECAESSNVNEQVQCNKEIPFTGGKNILMTRFFMEDFNTFSNFKRDAKIVGYPDKCQITGKQETIQGQLRAIKTNCSEMALPKIIPGKLYSSEACTKKEGSIFIGTILLTQHSSFQFLKKELKYLEGLITDVHCVVSLTPVKLQVRLKWTGKITAKEVIELIDKGLEKIMNFLQQVTVLKFKMKGSQLRDFKTFSKGKMSNIFVDYASSEVIAISSETHKGLKAKLKDLCLRYLKEDKADANVEIDDGRKDSCYDSRNAELSRNKEQFLCKREIAFTSGKHLFIRKYLMKDFYSFTNSIRDAKIKLFVDECIITGKQETIQCFEDFLQKTMTKIGVTEVKINFFGIQEFLQSSEGKNLIASIEGGNRCIIKLKSEEDKNSMKNKSLAPPLQVPSAVGIQQLSLQNGCFFANINVNLIPGEVNKQKTDIIVNTVNKVLDLRSGILSRTILHEAGDQIQQELQSNYPAGVEYGKFAISTGGNLPCKYIFHACLPFANGKNADEIMALVYKLLEEADRIHAKSFSIPALGTGGLGYTPTLSAKAIFGAISSFAQKNRQTQIQLINIVVFPKDQDLATTFRSILDSKESLVAITNQGEVTDLHVNRETPIEISQEVELQIFSDNANKRQLAEKLLQEECLSAFKKEEEKDNNIQRLKPNQIKELEKLGLQYGIKVNIQATTKKMTMEGFKSDGMLQVHKVKEKLILEAVGQHHKALLKVIPSSIEWQFQDSDGVWHNFSSLVNSELEKAYRTKASLPFGIFCLNEQGRELRFDFNSQIVSYNTKLGLETRRFRRNDKTKEGEPLPKHWYSMTETENLKIVEIPPGHGEYIEVSQQFFSKGANFPIKKIERIQNKTLYQQYSVKKRDMDLHNPKGYQNEQKLFHGTSSGPIPQINENGFNRSYCGVNGTVYGLGVYFAVTSSYSVRFATPDSQGNRYMYRVKVLTGELTETDSQTKYLPNKPGTNRPYDSGGCYNRGIYVIFHDAQVYPEYLITF